MKITVASLDIETLISLDKVMRPTREEIVGMIRDLCIRKQWTRRYLATLLGISAADMTLIERGVRDASGPLVRALWLFHALNTAPELAMNIISIATWGKGERELPVTNSHRMTSEEKEKVIAWLRAQKKRPSRREAAAHLQLHEDTVKRLCTEIGYRLADGRKHVKRMPALLRPSNVWLQQDWRLKDKEIAERLGVDEFQAYKARLFYRRISVAALKRHLLACGISAEDVETKWKPVFMLRVDWRKNAAKRMKKMPSDEKSKISTKVVDASLDSDTVHEHVEAQHENGQTDSGNEAGGSLPSQ